MRVFALVAALGALVAAGCAKPAAAPDHQAEWRDVLRHKKAATASDATAEHRQLYADSVREFLEKHPDHERAREVWQRLQIEFADELAAAGRYGDAARYYRAVLEHDQGNDDAKRGLDEALARLAVTRDKLLQIEKGMSPHAVSEILGRPVPGWRVRRERAAAEVEAWYYRTSDGGLAAVYFRDGRVFAAEETAHEPLGRLGS